jgi:subtilase family serine protease
MNLSIMLPLRNQPGLTGLLSRLYDPSSPDYHHFLSVAQFTEQFGPTAEDYQAVVDFAQANGFTVSNRPANRLIVPITGTVTQVENALHVRMKNYRHPTENRTFYSPDREPSLDLAVPVAHIAGLNNYSIPRPLVKKALAGQAPVNASVTGSGPGGSYLASDMRAAYYTSTVPTASTALTGSGQTVGLVEFDGYDISDVTSSFDGTATSTTRGSNYILAYTPASEGTTYSIPINNVLLDGASGAACQQTTSACDDSEEALDIVQAIGMAPGLSQVRLYIGFSDVDILNSMATENIAKQISISWGWSPDDPATDDALFQELAAQGQSVFAASGDDGAFDPLEDVSYPAEDAWLTAVGGTDLVTNSAGMGWNSEIAWTQSGGGVSPDGIPIPSWQAGVTNASNAGSTTLRNVPDVAAEGNFDNYDCDMGVCQGDWAGTSFATPRWAGFMALVNQQAVAAGSPTVGFINPALYTIGESSSYENDFHDITSGNNGATLYLAAAPMTLPGFNAVTGYDLITGWGSPDGQNLVDALAPPASAGFQLSASPSSLTLQPGTSGTTTITVQNVDGFTGKATLSLSGLPSGVTASFGASSATGISVLTLSASSSAIRGSYLVTITGTSGSVTATTTLALVVDAPGFSLAPSSTKLSLNAGTSGSTNITVIDYDGFTRSVSLAVTSGLPSGVTAAWTTNPTTGSSVLTLTASASATVGVSMVTITGISGSLSEITTVALSVYGSEFELNISPFPYTIAEGGSTTSTVTVVPVGAFSGSVELEASELPAGVTATFNPNPTTGTSVLTMTASKSAPLGTTLTQILGNGSYSGAGNQFFQTVTAVATPTFSVGISPVFMTLDQGASGTATVTIIPQNGFTGSVNLAAPYLPTGVTAAFSANTTRGTSVLTLTASSTTLPSGFYSVGITGSSGSIQNVVATLFLKVNPTPGYTLCASSSSVNISQGASATDIIKVTPQTGFTGNVTLSISSLPSGVTAAFGTNPTTGTSVLTLTASCSVAAGNYPAIVGGTSGTQTVTTPITVTVSSSTSCLVVPTTTALSINPSGGTLTADGSYTLTATVSPASGSTKPTGNVVFTIGTATQTVALNAAGIATFTGTAPAAGALTISSAYLGTPAFSASTSNTLNETVVVPTTTALSINPSGGTLTADGSYTLTATVSPASGSTKPTGNVVFTIGTATQTETLNASGIATFTGTAPAAGALTLSAAYLGTLAFSASTSNTLNETIVVPTTTALSINPGGGTLTADGSYTLTATVSPASGSTKPTGNVVFTIGSATQTETLNASGVATFTGTAPAAAGALTISSAYLGTPAFSASTSNTLNETVTTPLIAGYTVSGTAVTVVSGATSGNTSTITVTPSGGFTGSVELTAQITSGPAGALDPPTLSFGSTNPASISSTAAGAATLTITSTAATSAALAHPRRSSPPWYAAGGGTLVCLMLFGVPTQHRRWRSIFGIFALLVVLACGVSACGGGSSGGAPPPPSNPGTTPGTYAITVTATSGTTTAIGSVNLTVQ